MEKFSVSVNIAANSNVTFTLTYEELLKRRLGSYEIMTRVKPKQLVQNFEVSLRSSEMILDLIFKSKCIITQESNQEYITASTYCKCQYYYNNWYAT